MTVHRRLAVLEVDDVVRAWVDYLLVQALGAESEWLSNITRNLLCLACGPAIGLRAADRIVHVPPNRRANACTVGVRCFLSLT
jgi:hypothetical protein